MKKITFFLTAFCFLFLCQCKTKVMPTSDKQNKGIALSKEYEVLLLDSVRAAQEIITDKKDKFFERVTFTEMSIQMKVKRDCASRTICVQEYQDFLKTDVESFTDSDVDKITEAFEYVSELITGVNPMLIDRDILLIKTKGNHYGDGVFYTRENKIIIPQDALDNFNRNRFVETMLHEFFHIFSRYNKTARDEIYSLIGFQEVKGTLDFGSKGANKLLNPDGTTHYYIDLEKHGKAYPLITSTEDHYISSKPTFFAYLDFHLYKLEDGEDGIVNVKEAIEFEDAPSFFQQIKDNTNYIIHPDEISADNFIYAVFLIAQDKKVKDFSEEGMVLLDSFSKILQKHGS